MMEQCAEAGVAVVLVKEAEDEADLFPADFLIEPKAFEVFCEQGVFHAAAIQKFAREQTIAPGIVIGRLQHEGFVNYEFHNGLKMRLKWADE